MDKCNIVTPYIQECDAQLLFLVDLMDEKSWLYSWNTKKKSSFDLALGYF